MASIGMETLKKLPKSLAKRAWRLVEEDVVEPPSELAEVVDERSN